MHQLQVKNIIPKNYINNNNHNSLNNNNNNNNSKYKKFIKLKIE